MLSEITEKDAIGRKVKEFVYCYYTGQMGIVFDDLTFTIFGWDGDGGYIEERRQS